ncbi:multiheme c-type cytochrome [Bacteroidota bacterium]
MKRIKNFLKPVSAILVFGGISMSFHAYQQQKFKYDDFEKPLYCNQCHNLFYQQWDQAMMSDAYTHHWDEIEYFKLAVAHTENDPNVPSEVHEGCNGCHAPISFLAGDVPPPLPEKNSRANESVSCDVCHTITGFEGDIPFNHNYIIEPGKTKYSVREGEVKSPNHIIEKNEFLRTAEFCGICHNEESPHGVWVKSTHLELIEGPYYAEGVICHDCHMTKGPGKTAKMGARYEDTRLHLFHGAHDPGKLRGVVEIRMTADRNDYEPGEPLILTVNMFNQKTGHKFPTGSVEDRIVWLHVEAEDEEGKVYHLPVDPKGFEGEEYTIASEALAYQDLGVPLGIENFEGIRRETVPVGDRIFRMPYFDPQGRMTMMQWNTKSFGVDYRFGPRETKVETYTFNLPNEVAPGSLTINATLYYRLLVKSVADFLEVPEEESVAHVVNTQKINVTIYP